MEAEAPVWAHQRELSNLGILCGDIARRWPCDEVKVEDTSDDVVLEVLATFVVDVDVHSVGVEQENSVGRVAAVVKVDWVGTWW
jgi:hypothetical protein